MVARATDQTNALVHQTESATNKPNKNLPLDDPLDAREHMRVDGKAVERGQQRPTGRDRRADADHRGLGEALRQPLSEQPPHRHGDAEQGRADRARGGVATETWHAHGPQQPHAPQPGSNCKTLIKTIM